MSCDAAVSMDAFVLEAAGTGRFCLCYGPPAGVPLRSAILHVPAFAEEMNKSRRMVATTARALAADGHAVLLLDLFGCGDSGGEFADASWERWLQDLELGLAWLRARGAPRTWLWAHRAGALLASALMARCSEPLDLLVWQAVTSGKAVLRSLLRLKAAGAWADGNAKAVIAKAHADLAAGGSVAIAGYELTGALAASLEQATMQAPGTAAAGRRLLWLETRGGQLGELSAPALRFVEAWAEAGGRVHAQEIQGPAFWQTVEIEDAPTLTSATTEGLQRLEAADTAAPPASTPPT